MEHVEYTILNFFKNVNPAPAGKNLHLQMYSPSFTNVIYKCNFGGCLEKLTENFYLCNKIELNGTATHKYYRF